MLLSIAENTNPDVYLYMSIKINNDIWMKIKKKYINMKIVDKQLDLNVQEYNEKAA